MMSLMQGLIFRSALFVRLGKISFSTNDLLMAIGRFGRKLAGFCSTALHMAEFLHLAGSIRREGSTIGLTYSHDLPFIQNLTCSWPRFSRNRATTVEPSMCSSL